MSVCNKIPVETLMFNKTISTRQVKENSNNFSRSSRALRPASQNSRSKINSNNLPNNKVRYSPLRKLVTISKPKA